MKALFVRATLAALAFGILHSAVGIAARPPFTVGADAPVDTRLASEVRQEFAHAWHGYKQGAWGHDELKPLSRTAHDWYGTSLLMTPVDALDTMLIMGMKDEADRTRASIVENLSFDKDIYVKNFEITIRLLGGLLSSYQLTGDARLLAKAADLGNRLLPAFDSPTGMPYMFVNLKTGKTRGAESNPAEIGTLVLEFGTLAKLTKKPAFYDKPKKALVALHERRAKTGLVGEGINVETGAWTSKSSHIGGGIDSFYEYLLKCDRLFGDADCARMWRESIGPINKYLADDGPNGLWYGEADTETGRRTTTMYGSLQAFFPAVLALGGDIDRARRLQGSGFRMWNAAGVEPETFDYAAMKIASPGYQLRPEIIESAYYLAHYTGDARYVAMGRAMFDALKKYCRTENGYTILKDVRTKEQGDMMHSFFLAETLKYLYLLAKPDAIDFDKVTFNTEAHPLRRTW